MKKHSNKRKIIYSAIVILVVLLAGYGPISAAIGDYMEQSALVRDLAVMTGLSEEEIWHLKELRGDLDFVRDNIFVYKGIILTTKAAGLGSDISDGLIRDYEPVELYTVCQYLDENETDLSLAPGLLADHSSGKALSDVLDKVRLEKDFKVYVPATKEQVGYWLRQGYLPGDILMADEIARDADTKIEAVIAEKTAGTDWDAIADKYGSPASSKESEVKPAKLVIKDGDRVTTYEAETYEAAAEELGSAEKQDTEARETGLKNSIALPDEQIRQYLDQGFNINEINNAVWLSRESGVDVQRILDEKKSGSDWESLVKKYHDTDREAV